MNFRMIAVDDQPKNLLVLEEYLGSEFQVTSFSTGQKLIDHITNGGRADLILLDIVMPRPDGYTLSIWLKSNPATRDIPVIFLVSLESQMEEAYALSLGAEDFIHNPLSPPVVCARARNHLLLSQARNTLRNQNRNLENLMAERTRKIQVQAD